MRIISSTIWVIREITSIIKREIEVKREKEKEREKKSIIENLMSLKNWSQTPKGWGFNCSNYSDEEIDLIVKFFKQYHITPLSSSFINQISHGRFLVFSQKDVQYIINCKSYTKQNHLLKHDNLYVPLSDEAWKSFESVIQVSFGKGSSLIPQFVAKKLFIKKLKENMPKSIVANHILNKFVAYIHFMNQKNTPIQLTIHITPPTPENQEIDGFTKNVNEQPYIWLNFDFKKSAFNLITTFLHELKHVIQRYQGLTSFISTPQPTDMYRTVRKFAIEAEAKILTTLMENPHFYNDIIISHSNETFKAVTNGTENVCYLDDLSPQKKLAATFKHIQIESYHKTVDTLMDCFLSKSRIDMYKTLKKHNITIHPKMFNLLAWHIECWKKPYLSDILDVFITDPQRRQTSLEETKGLEEYWYKINEMKLNLAPSVVFSEELSRNLGVYDLIYGKDTKKSKKEKTYRIKYAGLDSQSENVRQLFDEGKYKEIFDIYDNLRQKNSFLPPRYNQVTEKQTAISLMSAIMEMHNQSPVKNVLERLNYETTNNHFDKLNWDRLLIGKYSRVNKNNERGS